MEIKSKQAYVDKRGRIWVVQKMFPMPAPSGERVFAVINPKGEWAIRLETELVAMFVSKA
jgi:hypothetical protein